MVGKGSGKCNVVSRLIYARVYGDGARTDQKPPHHEFLGPVGQPVSLKVKVCGTTVCV